MNLMLADPGNYLGIEATPKIVVVTQRGAKASHIHTDHAFDPVIRKDERVRAGSDTFARMNATTTIFAQRRPHDADTLLAMLVEVASSLGHAGDTRVLFDAADRTIRIG